MENISYPTSKDYSQYFDSKNTIFQTELLNRESRPELFNKFIFINEKASHLGYAKSFWHSASLGADDDHSKFEMYPCTNSTAYSNCIFKCDCDHEENFMKEDNSIPCIYRAAHVNLIKHIIDLANSQSQNEHLRIWRHKNKAKNENNLLIRYIKEETDYILIFKVGYNDKKDDIRQYMFITAFPVVLKSYKKRYDREYRNYMERK